MKDWTNEFGQGSLNSQLDVDQLVADCGLTEDEISWRKKFVGFDETDEQHLTNLAPLFREHTDEIADGFYDNLTGHEQTTDVIGRSQKTIDQLKRTQSAYLVTLASGEYGMDYFRNRARIGKIHDLLDMPMKHYLGQYGVYYDLIFPILFDRIQQRLLDQLPTNDTTPDAARQEVESSSDTAVADVVSDELDRGLEEVLAVLRIINLDMQVVADTYIHSYNQQLQASLRDRTELIQNVEQDLAQPIEELQESSEDIADSADDISRIAHQQADATEDISSEVGNMSATVEEIAATADSVAETSEHAEQLAAEGHEAATDAIEMMQSVDNSARDVAADVEQLQARIDEIDEIVEVINDIAEETNMLALNASIEAARAGEAGDGFAVVADEVKSLAEESQVHANEIEEMVGTIKADTANAVDSLKQTTTEIDQGITQVESAMETLQDIADAVAEASQGIQEVSDATSDQAASAEEVASMVDELVDQADEVATEIEAVAAANEEQTTQVHEINNTIQQLTDTQHHE